MKKDFYRSDKTKKDFYGERKSRIKLLPILIILVLLAVITAIILSWKRWEGKPPVVQLDKDFKALGRNPHVAVTVQDSGSGLKKFSVTLTQKNQTVPLVDEQYAGPTLGKFWQTGDRQAKTFQLGELIAAKYKIQDGSATLQFSAVDHSLRHFFNGNSVELQKSFVFDLYPPRLEVMSGQHYINQGGSDCVVYRVSPDAVISGVQAGPNFFPGYPVTGGEKDLKFALFAFAYNVDAKAPLKIIARDEAGNEAVTGFWYKLFPKTFRKNEIKIEDNFLQKVVPEILSRSSEVQDQGDLVKSFVEINSKLRQSNHALIKKLSEKSAQRFLWKDAFLQLSNSQVEALFADHRTYTYDGKVIDHQDHVGFDLSVVQQYPIEATNDGVVIYADYLGIYGNCVLIDHGYGLISLYGHLSSIDVKQGQSVKKKQVIGRSGETGLAAGDHLHFGLFLDG
ncbi:MAG TPA: M23 family metallopeptidase, partial [Acidobacteriota bacterium]|nr:M23 family metallopeptidase [Acidobacteriota bacterium]